MGSKKKHGRMTSSENTPRSQLNNDEGEGGDRTRPELVRRKMNRQSTFRMGRTIGEKREKLETKSERTAARKQDKRRQARRIFFTVLGFIILISALVFLCFFFVKDKESTPILTPTEELISTEPTIEIIDEDASAGSRITNRMRSYVGQAEQDFRDLNYKPVKAVIPSGAIREVDFYLEGYSGFFKLYIDRPSATSVEDADRMLRYLANQGITDFQYIDVRIAGKAYWK